MSILRPLLQALDGTLERLQRHFRLGEIGGGFSAAFLAGELGLAAHGFLHRLVQLLVQILNLSVPLQQQEQWFGQSLIHFRCHHEPLRWQRLLARRFRGRLGSRDGNGFWRRRRGWRRTRR